MKFKGTLLTPIVLVFAFTIGFTQNQWPRTIENPQAKITLYQPQPESFTGDKLSARAAVSVTPPSKDPIFGAEIGRAHV